MQNKAVRFGPVALAAAAANILNPGTTTGGVNMPASSGNLYFIITHIRLVEKSGSARTVSLYIGATGGSAAGTEFAFNAAAIAANGFLDWYGRLTLDAADFLTGLASAATSVTFEAEGEIGVR